MMFIFLRLLTMLDNALFIVGGVEPQIHHDHGQTHLSVKKKKIIERV